MLGVQNPDVSQSTCCSEAWKCILYLLLQSFWWLPAILDISWLAATGLQSLPLLSHGLSRSTSLCLSWFFSSYKDSSRMGFRAHCNSLWHHLNNWLCLPKAMFPNKVTFTGFFWMWIWRERGHSWTECIYPRRFTGLFGTAWFSFTAPFNILIPHITKKEPYRE